jgi:hypothetical protein
MHGRRSEAFYNGTTHRIRHCGRLIAPSADESVTAAAAISRARDNRQSVGIAADPASSALQQHCRPEPPSPIPRTRYRYTSCSYTDRTRPADRRPERQRPISQRNPSACPSGSKPPAAKWIAIPMPRLIAISTHYTYNANLVRNRVLQSGTSPDGSTGRTTVRGRMRVSDSTVTFLSHADQRERALSHQVPHPAGTSRQKPVVCWISKSERARDPIRNSSPTHLFTTSFTASFVRNESTVSHRTSLQSAYNAFFPKTTAYPDLMFVHSQLHIVIPLVKSFPTNPGSRQTADIRPIRNFGDLHELCQSRFQS